MQQSIATINGQYVRQSSSFWRRVFPCSSFPRLLGTRQCSSLRVFATWQSDLQNKSNATILQPLILSSVLEGSDILVQPSSHLSKRQSKSAGYAMSRRWLIRCNARADHLLNDRLVYFYSPRDRKASFSRLRPLECSPIKLCGLNRR